MAGVRANVYITSMYLTTSLGQVLGPVGSGTPVNATPCNMILNTGGPAPQLLGFTGKVSNQLLAQVSFVWGPAPVRPTDAVQASLTASTGLCPAPPGG